MRFVGEGGKDEAIIFQIFTLQASLIYCFHSLPIKLESFKIVL